MKPEKIINIKDKLTNIGVDPEKVSLGEFDYVAEFTAKRQREPNSELWKKAGAFFKPNLERGILIHSLITKYKLRSYLEIGFGRGYSAICAARAFAELGNDGQALVIEPSLDEEHMQRLGKVLPKEWTSRLKIARGSSADILPKMRDRYDLVYIDGDHTVEGVKRDWEGAKSLFSCFCLFDDYHMDTAEDQAIKVKEALEECELPAGLDSELIIMDRRIFIDDRRWPDEKVRYGQLLLTNGQALADREKEVTVGETWDW